MVRWWELEKRATLDGEPLTPQRAFFELNQRLPDESIITADSGTAASWYARHIKMRRGMMGSLSGNLASMVPGVPYAIAAKFAHQDRPAIAFVGDGAMQMLGLNELITARHYYRMGRPETDRVRPEQWRPEHGHLGDEGLRGESQIRGVPGGPVVPYAEFAEMIGLRGIKVEKPEEVGPAWDQLLAADRPSVLEVVCDPDVPTIPPHVTLDQFGKYMSSLLKGDSETLGVLWQSARQGGSR